LPDSLGRRRAAGPKAGEAGGTPPRAWTQPWDAARETDISTVIAWLERQPGWAVVVAALVLALVLGAVDAVTGFEISFALFYLLPVALAAWAAGKRAGALMAAICAVVWLIADQVAGQALSQPAVTFWNAIARFGVFVVVALLLAELRQLLVLERQLARSDQLTGLLNRRAFFDIVQAELERARRFSHPVTLLYLDIDNFKSFNDALGHEAGDHLLERVAGAIRTTVRTVDSAARLGGDEFGILLPETDRRMAQVVGARLREALHASGPGEVQPLSASIGAVSCLVVPDSVEALVAAADSLMYQVKRSSKDGVQYMEYAG
jgi:diguanylate cyclase (GGDEF)-like protein